MSLSEGGVQAADGAVGLRRRFGTDSKGDGKALKGFNSRIILSSIIHGKHFYLSIIEYSTRARLCSKSFTYIV